jgi:Ser/Thr protein kinase RdoA (MazF antagonist)
MSTHRGAVTPSLLSLLREQYGLRWNGEPTDLGGAMSLNVLLPVESGAVVARLYPIWTTIARLEAIQHVRRALVAAGLPFAETIPDRKGVTWTILGECLLEVERYVPGENMDLEHGLMTGLPLLGRIHTVLCGLRAPAAAFKAPVANHVGPEEALAVTRAGVAAIHAMNPAPEEIELGSLALQLAEELREAETALAMSLPRQLVHGDFWDNNVLFRDGRITVVLDLDFMGGRARIDDLALTLYYTNSTLGSGYTSDDRISRLAGLVDAYDTGLGDRLSEPECLALPFALARTVLFCMRYMPGLDRAPRRKLIREIQADVRWSLEVVRDVGRWQDALLAGR